MSAERLSIGAMPEMLALARHGETTGQITREQDIEHTTEFRQTPTIQHNLTRNGFAQSRTIAPYLVSHVFNSTVFPHDHIDRGICAATHRAEQSLGAVLLQGNKDNTPIIGTVTGGMDRIGTEVTDTQPEYWVTSDARINEIEFGWLETSPRREMDAAYPDAARARDINHFTARPPGGESPADVLSRARDILGVVARMHSKGIRSVYMSTHGRFRTMVDFALRGINALEWDKFNAENKVENAELLLLSRRNPQNGELAGTLRWRAVANPWRHPDTPPVWEAFEAPKPLSLDYLLRDIPPEWHDDLLADRNGRVPHVKLEEQ